LKSIRAIRNGCSFFVLIFAKLHLRKLLYNVCQIKFMKYWYSCQQWFHKSKSTMVDFWYRLMGLL